MLTTEGINAPKANKDTEKYKVKSLHRTYTRLTLSKQMCKRKTKTNSNEFGGPLLATAR